MVPSFSTGEKVQVEYSISPPGFSMEMADETHSRWSLAKNVGLVSSQVLAPAALLPVTPGDYVLDLCAAPGGKATELGAGLEHKGMLVAMISAVHGPKPCSEI